MATDEPPTPSSRYPDVEEPVPVLEAFQQTGEVSAQSQAAFLLAVGGMLESPDEAEARSFSALAEEPEPLMPEEDWTEMQIPSSFFELETQRGVRRAARAFTERVGTDTVRQLASAREFGDKAVSLMTELAPELAERACEADVDAAMDLIGVSLRHPQPLVRVAAATSALVVEATDEERELARTELLAGIQSEEPLVREVARTSMARFEPRHPYLGELTEGSESSEEGEPSHTSLLVHGTFALHNSWWQPGGDFHTYLHDQVRPDLYSAGDRFDWSGGYSDAARSVAAGRLHTWVTDRGLEGLDLFCHSHGGSVAMEASQNGLEIGKLVLLSCPVHRGKYDPNFAVIQDCVISIRVRLDLVILADRGGQKFRDPQIRENRLPIWFKHSATHRERVWRNHDVPDRLHC